MAEEDEPVQTNEVPLLPLRLGGSWLAVPALQVLEVVDDAEPLFLPGAPAHVPGLLNLRGTALPLLDLQRFLDLPDSSEAASTSFPRVVVVEAAEMTVGLRCDAVLGVLPAGGATYRAGGGGGGRLAAISAGEVDLSRGIATVIELAPLLEQARVRD